MSDIQNGLIFLLFVNIIVSLHIYITLLTIMLCWPHCPHTDCCAVRHVLIWPLMCSNEKRQSSFFVETILLLQNIFSKINYLSCWLIALLSFVLYKTLLIKKILNFCWLKIAPLISLGNWIKSVCPLWGRGLAHRVIKCRTTSGEMFR